MYKQTKQEIKALRERAEAVEKEEHRRLVDAAKKRAAAQHVDYPTFAAMVSVAHLQPIQRKRADQVQSARSKWTPRGWCLDEALGAEDDKLSQSLANDPLAMRRWQAYEREATWKLLHTIENVAGDSKPRERLVLSSDLFVKEWRKLSGNLNLRMRMLRKLCPEDIPRIFKTELPSRLLTEMLETLRSWQLNGMTCSGTEPSGATETKDASFPSVCNNLQSPNSEGIALAQQQQRQHPQDPVPAGGGSFSPDLLQTLANIKLLNEDYSANEGGDPHSELPPYVGEREHDEEVEDAEEGASQVEWVTTELASIAESRQPTREEKSQRFQQLVRNKKMLWLLRFLHALTRCGRFDLALKMGKRGRATASSILDLLVADMPKEPDNQDDSNPRRSYYECRPNFVMPPPGNIDEAPTELNLEQMKYLRAIFLH